MKRLVILAAALLLGASALAQTPRSRPLTSSPFKTVLYSNQEVTLSGQSAMHANVAPLVVASGGMTADRLVTEVSGWDIGGMPTIPLANPTTQQTAIQAAEVWMQANQPAFAARIAAYIKSKGISNAFYSYTQEFNMSTAAGVRKKSIAWNINIDTNARGIYGSPKVVDSDPIFIMAQYMPKTVAEGLPAHWAPPAGGLLSYEVRNKKWEVIVTRQTIDTGGAYDQDQSGSEKLACLMDHGYGAGTCYGNITIRQLLDNYGAAAAFVDYVRQLEPVYKETKNPDGTVDMVAQGAISYDARIVNCGTLRNSGFYGYALSLIGERYLAQPSTGLVQYQAIQQFQGKTSSPQEAFSKEIPVAALGGRSADAFVISPLPGENTLLDKYDPAIVYVADLRADADGTGAINNVSANVGDVSVVQSGGDPSQGGGVKEYDIGNRSTGSWPPGMYDRSIWFQTGNPAATQEFALVLEAMNDWLMVKVNGHIVYVGPPWGDMLELGQPPVHLPGYAMCMGGFWSVDGRWTCQYGGAMVGTAPEQCGGGDAWSCSCPAGTVAVNGMCGIFGPAVFDSCYINYGGQGGDVGTIHVESYDCQAGCLPGQVQFKGSGADKCGTADRGGSVIDYRYVDLRPYLVAGQNEISLRTIVAGGWGEGWVRIRTRSCPGTEVGGAGAPPPVPVYGGAGGVGEAITGILNR